MASILISADEEPVEKRWARLSPTSPGKMGWDGMGWGAGAGGESRRAVAGVKNESRNRRLSIVHCRPIEAVTERACVVGANVGMDKRKVITGQGEASRCVA